MLSLKLSLQKEHTSVSGSLREEQTQDSLVAWRGDSRRHSCPELSRKDILKECWACLMKTKSQFEKGVNFDTHRANFKIFPVSWDVSELSSMFYQKQGPRRHSPKSLLGERSFCPLWGPSESYVTTVNIKQVHWNKWRECGILCSESWFSQPWLCSYCLITSCVLSAF